MIEIPLTRGYVAIIDDEDARLAAFKWFAWCGGPGQAVYAGRNRKKAEGPRGRIYLHREVMGAGPGVLVDHVDRDGLNNRRSNLRFATSQQNQGNRKRDQTNTSGFRGVCREKRRNKWMAHITINGRLKFLGYFEDPEQAARAYDAAAIRYFGEFARPNFPTAPAVLP